MPSVCMCKGQSVIYTPVSRCTYECSTLMSISYLFNDIVLMCIFGTKNLQIGQESVYAVSQGVWSLWNRKLHESACVGGIV